MMKDLQNPQCFFGILLIGHVLTTHGKSISIHLDGEESLSINGGLREYEEPIQINKRTGSFEGLSRFLEIGNKRNKTKAPKRQTRAARWNVDSLVDESWEVEWTTPNPDPKLGLQSVLQVSSEEIRRAQLAQVKDVIIYSGSIFGSSIFIIVFAVMFFRHPESFICGCCCSYFCIKMCCPRLHLYMTNPEKYVHDRMNKYIPGMIVEEDGKIIHYQPTVEELDLLTQVMEQLMEP